MTVPRQGAPLVDQGNPLLGQVPAQMDTGTVDIPGSGTLGVLTIRTTSATVTVMLAPQDLQSWGEILTSLAGKLRGGLVQATPIDMAALGQLPGIPLEKLPERGRRHR